MGRPVGGEDSFKHQRVLAVAVASSAGHASRYREYPRPARERGRSGPGAIGDRRPGWHRAERRRLRDPRGRERSLAAYCFFFSAGGGAIGMSLFQMSSASNHFPSTSCQCTRYFPVSLMGAGAPGGVKLIVYTPCSIATGPFATTDWAVSLSSGFIGTNWLRLALIASRPTETGPLGGIRWACSV